VVGEERPDGEKKKRNPDKEKKPEKRGRPGSRKLSITEHNTRVTTFFPFHPASRPSACRRSGEGPVVGEYAQGVLQAP